MELLEMVVTAVKNHDKERRYDPILAKSNAEHYTALHLSVRGKQAFVTKLLLDAGVPIEKCDRNEDTALHIAARNEDLETIKIIMPHLIKKGKEHHLADRGWEYMKELARENKKKEIPVCIPKTNSILTCMLQAWKHTHEVPFGENRRGLLLHLAVFEKNGDLVKEILKAIEEIGKHADKEFGEMIGKVLSTRDTEDLTPLHVAAETGNEVIGNELISVGADVQLNSAKGTPFELAMQKDHTGFAISLVEKGANIKKYLNLLAYDAISDEYIENEILKKKKVNLNRRISSADCTVIHYAAKQSKVPRIELLLRNGIALAASDRDGRRVLHYTIQYRDDYDVMKFFLDEATRRDEFKRKREPGQLTYMGALMQRDLDGVTPVMLAARLDRIKFFELLTTDKYEYLLRTFSANDPDHNNVIHYLARYKSIRTAEYIVPYIHKINIDLFTHIMNDRNVDGHSPIDLARKRGDQKMVDLFVDLCDLEYFEACPDVVHRMVRDRDYNTFSKVLDKAVIQDSQNVQIATKLMDSNEEGDYPDFRFFNFHLAPLWHKLYRSKSMKYRYHPILKFLIEEKLNIYRVWFGGLLFLYLFFFYIPLSFALLLASYKRDFELFSNNTHLDRFRFCLEAYIMMLTLIFIFNEWFEIRGKQRYLENLFYSSNELDYKRPRQVQYSSESDLKKWSIKYIVRFVFYELPVKIYKRIYDFDKRYVFFPRTIYRHLRETYNVIDICSVLFLILLFFFRLSLFFTQSLSQLHWTCSALTFTFFTFKFYKYTKIFPSLGIYIETLSNVLSADVPRFSLVILILLISYIGSIQLVARTYCIDGGQCSFSSWFGDDTLPYSPLTTPFISGLLFIIDGGPGNYEGSLRDVPIVFSFFYLVFAFCIIVVLLNVFIAQLSQTYSNIYANKDLLDFKAELALDYETQSSIIFKWFSPLRRPLKRIPIESIIIPLDTWKSYNAEYEKRVGDLGDHEVPTKDASGSSLMFQEQHLNNELNEVTAINTEPDTNQVNNENRITPSFSAQLDGVSKYLQTQQTQLDEMSKNQQNRLEQISKNQQNRLDEMSKNQQDRLEQISKNLNSHYEQLKKQIADLSKNQDSKLPDKTET